MKKKVTEIRDDVFFRKLLDVSKNAVFIGWCGIYRKEYQALIKENLPHLRELSIIENAGFDSTNISVALYVFTEETSPFYISKVYDGDKVVHTETYGKAKIKGDIEWARRPTPKEDSRPTLGEFYKTEESYLEGAGVLFTPKPWDELKDERVEWKKGGNEMLCDMSFRNWLGSVRQDMEYAELFNDVKLLYAIRKNFLKLDRVKKELDEKIERMEHGI